MTNRKKTGLPRLRFFEQATSQRHITDDDRYLYAQNPPEFRLAVIGTGTIGQEHMRVATLLGRASIHGIYDRSATSMTVATEEFARYSDAPLVAYDTLEAACNDPGSDALMICTPNHTHIDVLETAAKTGKPIFLEKPMATTLSDARRVIEIVQDYPAFIQVGLQYRYKAPYVEALHEALDRKSLGAIKTISMSEYRPPFLDKVEQWNKFAKFSGGTLVEKCCHYFDIINLLAESPPARVFASGGQAVNFVNFERNGSAADIDDHAMVIIDYRNGIRASFTLNMFAPHFHEELVVCGDGGRMVASESFNFLQDDVARSSLAIELGETGASRTIELGYPRAIEQSGHHGATFFEHIAFADQMRGQSASSATPLQGLWSIIIASAAQASIKGGGAVDIDTFVRDNELDSIVGNDVHTQSDNRNPK